MQPSSGGHWPTLWRVTFLLLVLAIGFRFDVGGDWLQYLDIIDSMRGVSLIDAVSNLRNDFLYTFLNWISANFEIGGVYFTNVICGTIFSWGLIEFCRAQPRAWLALTVAIPYLVIVVAMGYTRQGVAIGAVMLGLVALSEQKIMKFMLFMILAAAFHKTAVVLMPLALFSTSKNRALSAFLVVGFAGLFYLLLLQDATDNFRENYIGAQYESSGAAIRVVMNVLPAMIFLFFRKNFALNHTSQRFWTWMSLGGLVFVILLALSPSSTAVDRMALYWIPLQLFVLSRVPDALGRASRKANWVFVVVAYCAAVQFTWLFFAKTAFAWLPYQFYPWVALWN